MLAIALLGCPGAPKDQPERATAPAAPRGIVLVTVQGWWDPKPATDSIPTAFVANEIRLADAMTPSPQLRPAIGSMLTGLSPVEIGVRNDVTTPIAASAPLVSRSLTDRGWQTAAFVSDPRVGEGSGLERGFTVFDAPKEILFGSFRRIPRVRAPDEVVADFSKWVATVPDGTSFFAWIQISGPEGVREALDRLSKLVTGTPRLADAAVALVGTSGRIVPDEGEHSGYVLNADVLRVPAIFRSGGSSASRLDSAAPFALMGVARWITVEAGMDAGPGDARSHGAARIAWTWRGRDEFGWPAEIAAQHGTALCVHSVPGADDRCVPWTGSAVADSDRQACLSILEQQPKSWSDPPPVAPLPKALLDRLDRTGVRARPGAAPARRSVSREIRSGVVAAVMKARRIDNDRKAAEADAEYQRALARDPGNFGVLIEAGEALALSGLTKQARARLERAIELAPSHPEAWHWLGHVAYLEKQLDRADAQWEAADALRGGNADVLYDLACSRSIMGRVADSESYLRRAWTAGFRDVNKIQVDPDLRNLRADPSFLRFMREVVH